MPRVLFLPPTLVLSIHSVKDLGALGDTLQMQLLNKQGARMGFGSSFLYRSAPNTALVWKSLKSDAPELPPDQHTGCRTQPARSCAFCRGFHTSPSPPRLPHTCTRHHKGTAGKACCSGAKKRVSKRVSGLLQLLFLPFRGLHQEKVLGSLRHELFLELRPWLCGLYTVSTWIRCFPFMVMQMPLTNSLCLPRCTLVPVARALATTVSLSTCSSARILVF